MPIRVVDTVSGEWDAGQEGYDVELVGWKALAAAIGTSVPKTIQFARHSALPVRTVGFTPVSTLMLVREWKVRYAPRWLDEQGDRQVRARAETRGRPWKKKGLATSQ